VRHKGLPFRPLAMSTTFVGIRLPPPMHTRLSHKQGIRAVVDEHILLIGDAAGHIDPLTGEGIHTAMQVRVQSPEISRSLVYATFSLERVCGLRLSFGPRAVCLQNPHAHTGGQGRGRDSAGDAGCRGLQRRQLPRACIILARFMSLCRALPSKGELLSFSCFVLFFFPSLHPAKLGGQAFEDRCWNLFAHDFSLVRFSARALPVGSTKPPLN
jgi:hypothetical protein